MEPEAAEAAEPEAEVKAEAPAATTEAAPAVAEAAPVAAVAEEKDRGYTYSTWALAFPFVGTGKLDADADMSSGWFNRMVKSTARYENSHPEWGGAPIVEYDMSYDEQMPTNFGMPWDRKLAEQELMHGRWAMLGVTGMVAAENTTGVPWYEAGGACNWDPTTPCTLMCTYDQRLERAD